MEKVGHLVCGYAAAHAIFNPLAEAIVLCRRTKAELTDQSRSRTAVYSLNL